MTKEWQIVITNCQRFSKILNRDYLQEKHATRFLNYKKLHLNRKVKKQFKTNFLDYLDCATGESFLYVQKQMHWLNLCDFPKEIQCIAMKLNVSGRKYLMFSVHILVRLSKGLEFCLISYEKICVLANVNVTVLLQCIC